MNGSYFEPCTYLIGELVCDELAHEVHDGGVLLAHAALHHPQIRVLHAGQQPPLRDLVRHVLPAAEPVARVGARVLAPEIFSHLLGVLLAREQHVAAPHPVVDVPRARAVVVLDEVLVVDQVLVALLRLRIVIVLIIINLCNGKNA
jgi:hypothetical protein